MTTKDEVGWAIPDALLENRGWRPIETAPRDGTAILIIKAGFWKPGVHFVPVVAAWISDWIEREYEGPWQISDELHYDDDVWSPTHWMPLPPPPEVEP